MACANLSLPPNKFRNLRKSAKFFQKNGERAPVTGKIQITETDKGLRKICAGRPRHLCNSVTDTRREEGIGRKRYGNYLCTDSASTVLSAYQNLQNTAAAKAPTV
jgi:hypothetical protein